MKSLLLGLLFLACVARLSWSVDRSKFRTCKDTRFCRKFRPLGETRENDNQYKVVADSLQFLDATITAKVRSSSKYELTLYIVPLSSGSIRVKLTENEPRWQPTDLLLEVGLKPAPYERVSAADPRVSSYGLPSSAGLVYLLLQSLPKLPHRTDPNEGLITPLVLVLSLDPLRIDLYHGAALLVSVNERSLLHYEVTDSFDAVDTKPKTTEAIPDADRHKGKEVVSYGEDGLAVYADGSREERVAEAADTTEDIEKGDSFGGHSDSQPNGPASVGLDFAFPFANNVYGIPEHTSPLSLPATSFGPGGQAKYNDPYRLYNLDVFEYELDTTMALYGHIPLMLAHGLVQNKGVTAGIFWFNPSETFVDVSDGLKQSNGLVYKRSHWLSETGDIDVFLLPGPSIPAVYAQYTALIGTQQLPPLFALGYHQCRWNYIDERDVATVEGMFENLDYPVDVIWLDIEHTDGKRYFTWDKNTFPNPLEMQKNVSAHGRRMVTIVDPHIKVDDGFPVHKEAKRLGYYIKKKDGTDFDGWCWPGSSSYLDFTDPRVRKWWGDRFALEVYQGSTMDLFTWNDMNEPSVFNGPEVSMPKDCKNLKGVEHRYWHNLYGLYMQSATSDGLTARVPLAPSTSIFGSLAGVSAPKQTPDQQQRPFVLSRAFWAGSQRFGAIWTGDNTADWGHLKIAAPMLLSINLAGLSFAGADVGGFFGEPSAELFTRWYQAGSFTPFFRGHAHEHTKRREPWVFGDPYTGILRSASILRYTLLPFWYTVFASSHSTGLPVMRPLFTVYPDDSRTFALDDEWMVGDSLLVAPVTDDGVRTADVYLPGDAPWYDLITLQAIAPSNNRVKVNAPLDKIPVFVRGGKIVPRKMRLRRSSKLMFYDPLTLLVALDYKGYAHGTLYMDDEITMAYLLTHASITRSFVFNNNVLSCGSASILTASSFKPMNTVERVVVAGLSKAVSKATLRTTHGEERQLEVTYDSVTRTATVKKPDVPAADDWAIQLE